MTSRNTQKPAYPAWASGLLRFIQKFATSCQALFEVFWNLGSSIAELAAFVATKIFSAFGSKLNPVFASKVFIFICTCVILWSLWSWVAMGQTIFGLFGASPFVGGVLGLVIGFCLNIVEIVPEMGLLFEEYADVFARKGDRENAEKFDRWSVTSKNFTQASLARLDAFRNIACICEFLASAWYQFLIGGLTKTIKTKLGTTWALQEFWSVTGALLWCAALVKGPEYSVKAACAMIHVAANLPDSAYLD